MQVNKFMDWLHRDSKGLRASNMRFTNRHRVGMANPIQMYAGWLVKKQ